MPDWTAIGAVIGALSLLVAGLTWWSPRSPGARSRHQRVWVETSNAFPVFGELGQGGHVGDHTLCVTLKNGSTRPVKVVSWGIRIPGNRNMAILTPEHWSSPIPTWVQPGDGAAWFVPAATIRAEQAKLGCSFRRMRPWVSLADGRTIKANKPVLLA